MEIVIDGHTYAVRMNRVRALDNEGFEEAKKYVAQFRGHFYSKWPCPYCGSWKKCKSLLDTSCDKCGGSMFARCD